MEVLSQALSENIRRDTHELRQSPPMPWMGTASTRTDVCGVTFGNADC